MLFRSPPATVAGGALLLILVLALRDVHPAGYTGTAPFDSQIGMVDRLGLVLYKEYMLPFELASVLLLAAMVGSVMLGNRETGERNF